MAYFPGDVAEFEEKQAIELLASGRVELVDEKGVDLPKDLPGRDAIVKAGISLEDLKKMEKIEEFQEIQGIGKKTAELLKSYWSRIFQKQ